MEFDYQMPTPNLMGFDYQMLTPFATIMQNFILMQNT